MTDRNKTADSGVPNRQKRGGTRDLGGRTFNGARSKTPFENQARKTFEGKNL